MQTKSIIVAAIWAKVEYKFGIKFSEMVLEISFPKFSVLQLVSKIEQIRNKNVNFIFPFFILIINQQIKLK